MQHLLCSDIRDEGHVTQECDSLWDPEKFTLTYEMNSSVYELYDEQQILYVHVLVLSFTCTCTYIFLVKQQLWLNFGVRKSDRKVNYLW